MKDWGKRLGEKLGPLPVWAWGGLAAGAVWVWRLMGRRGMEDGGETFSPSPVGGGGSVPLLPAPVGTAPPPPDPGFGVPDVVEVAPSVRVSVGDAGGRFADIEGPAEVVERVLPQFGGIVQPPPPVRVVEKVVVQPPSEYRPPSSPKPQPKPAPARPAPVPPPGPAQPVKTVPVRKPDPVAAQTPARRTYVVKRGDSLSKIARRFGYRSWRPIYDANRSVIGSNPNLIFPGQRLVLP